MVSNVGMVPIVGRYSDISMSSRYLHTIFKSNFSLKYQSLLGDNLNYMTSADLKLTSTAYL